eukprot:10898124-Heterocapsa_arctica.AAC.1
MKPLHICLSSQAIRGRGGGKRAREVGAGVHAIPIIMGRPATFNDDCIEVKAAFAATSVNIKGWVEALPTVDLADLSTMTDKFSLTGLTDTSIRAYAQKLPVYSALELVESRIAQSKLYILGLLKHDLGNFCGDGSNSKKVHKFFSLVKIQAGIMK